MTVERVGDARMSGEPDSPLRLTGQAGRFTRRQVLAATVVAAGASVAHSPAAAAAEASGSIVSRLRPEHPRLWVTMDDIVALKSRIASNPNLARWHAQSRQAGERILTQPVSEYDISRGNLLNVSRQVRNRTLLLSMLYHLNEDDRFAERTWRELQAAAGFPDWYPSQFLSTAEMTHAFGIGYDWLYHYLDESQRETVRNAIAQMGLRAALPEYRSPEAWSVENNNWNLVCNGGMGTGALAIGDEVPELAEEILQSSLESVPIAIAEYAPDGGYPEGLNYWSYATRYLVAYIAAMQTAIGDDLGLSDSPGLSGTGYFPLYLSGPAGQSFNFNDAPNKIFRSPELFWLAKRYNRPMYTWWGVPGAEDKNAIRYVLWYDPATDTGDSPREAGLPFDKHFRQTEVATFRGAWHLPRAVFTGFKGGDNQTNHGDLGLGTFILDALGRRWGVELGKDSYRLPGYFDSGADGQRWTYYRKRAEGQNTLVVNPGSGPDQDPLAKGKIIRTEYGDTRAFAVADLTEAYADRGVTSWHRGLAMLDHRRQVLVQDEVQARKPADSWWFMHTTAEVDIADDGRSATLRHGDKRMLARILAPETDAVFTVMEAAPLDTSPDPEQQSENPGVRKLAIHLTGVTSLRLAVVFSPLRRWQEPEQDLPDVEPLADWNVPHREVPQLSELSVDGKPLEEFSPNVFTYDLVDFKTSGNSSTPPAVDAAAGDARVIVHQARTAPGTARIDVIKPRAPRVRYEVNFDWTITAPFSDTWDFRNQDPDQVIAGSEGSRAVFGETERSEVFDPEWVESPAPDATGAHPMVVSLNGDEDVVTVVDTVDVDLSPGFEFEAWIYQRARTRLPRIMHKGYGGFWINRDGSVRMQQLSMTGAKARTDTVAGVIPLNAWTHVGVRYELTDSDERRFRIFVNGEEAPTVREEGFSRGTRLDVVGHAMRLGNVDSHTRGLDGLLAFARLTVPIPDGPPQWNDGLFT